MHDEPKAKPQERGASGDQVERYLCFSLGAEEYAIPLLSVKEVIALPEISPVPHVPSHVLGIMNLRGQVISIVDLRVRLGMKAVKTAETAVIICDLPGASIGVVVDAINSVLSAKESDIVACPEVPQSKHSEFIKSVYRVEKHMILFLDVTRAVGFSLSSGSARTAA